MKRTSPTLILVGAEHVADMLTVADILEQKIAGAEQIVIPKTAHLPNMEEPEAFNRVELAFLRSLDDPE